MRYPRYRHAAAQHEIAEAKAETWNKAHAIGLAVRYTAVRGRKSPEDRDTRTRSEAWAASGSAIVLIDGKAGGVSLDHLEVLP